jgi:hypothetical protein
MADITRRVLVSFEGDPTKLVRAQDEIEDGTRAMTEQFGASAAAAHRAFDTIGLGADKQVGRLQKLSSGFQSFTGKIGQGIGAIDNFAKTLGPWNQAMELGGKAIAFADAGLEAFSKTSPQAAAEVKRLRDDFTSAKDAAMEFTGAVVIAATKPLMSLKELETQIRGVTGAFQDAFNASKNGKGLGYLLSGGFIDDAKKSLAAQADPWASTPDIGAGIANARKQHEDKLKADAVKRAAAQKAYAHRDRDVSEYASITGMDTVGAPIGYSNSLGQAAVYEDNTRSLLDAHEAASGKALTEDWQRRLGEQRTEKTNFLESTFGPIDEFNAYAEAFGMLTGGVTSAMDAWISGSMSAGEAVKKFIGTALKGLASQMAIEALKHGAYALGSLAFGDIGGAGRHAAAAAAFGAGAAAAAVAAKQMSSSGSSASGGGGGGSSSGGSGGAGGSTSAPSGSADGDSGKSRPVYILMGDSFSSDSPRMRSIRANEAMDKALRERDE